MSLSGKVALVTRDSRGIGGAVALRLARDRPAVVVVNYAGSLDPNWALVRDIAQAGSRAIAVQADMS
jgi:3-oxoacyl-[acyl-carrier protein] reductase